jgi:hypothetical protein
MAALMEVSAMGAACQFNLRVDVVRAVVSFAAFFCALVFVSAASAQVPRPWMDPRIGIKGVVGLGGEADFDFETDQDSKLDMEATIGLAGQLELPLHEYFVIGGLIGAQWWDVDNSDPNFGRSTMMDIDVLLKLRAPVRARRSFGEIYAAVPVGFSFNFLHSSYERDLTNVDSGFGWNYGIVGGVQWFFSDDVGILGEVGYVVHRVQHRVKAGQFAGDLDIDFGQVQLAIGAMFIL